MSKTDMNSKPPAIKPNPDGEGWEQRLVREISLMRQACQESSRANWQILDFMEKMKSPEEIDNGAGAVATSTLDVANALIRQQKYLLHRQADLNRAVICRNVELVKAANQCERENHKLRKELDGYKQGRLWTMVCSFLPTTTFGNDRF
jgi:hypothetical protein